MVVLQIKRGEGPEVLFCYEASLTAAVAETARQVAMTHNLLLLVRELLAAAAAEADVAGGGPWAPVVAELKDMAGMEGSKQALSQEALLAGLDRVRQALLTAFHDELPAAVQEIFSSAHSAADGWQWCGAGAVEPAEAVLWFAGKQMQASKALGDYLGRNEKTRAVVKLMARGAPAPPREPALDPKTQQEITAWFYKRQQEQQRLAQEDDPVSSAPWASSNQLKQHFTGVSRIRMH